MSKVIDRPIVIQKIDPNTEEWKDLFHVHAYINKARTDDQYLRNGSTRTRKNLVFEIRYFQKLEPISLNLQGYRIVYLGTPYALEDYDDYLLRHKTVKLLGVSYER